MKLPGNDAGAPKTPCSKNKEKSKKVARANITIAIHRAILLRTKSPKLTIRRSKPIIHVAIPMAERLLLANSYKGNGKPITCSKVCIEESAMLRRVQDSATVKSTSIRRKPPISITEPAIIDSSDTTLALKGLRLPSLI